MAISRPSELLRLLLEANVEFVVVGGVAAIAHGVATMTDALDVVAPLIVENCRRILAAVGPYEPRFYQTLGKPPVTRTAEELSEFRNLYFSTTLGVVDFLGTLPPIGTFREVAARSIVRTLHGLECRIISLDDLIAVKAHVGRPKDKSVEFELRAIRDLTKKK